MPKIDAYEQEVLTAFETGVLKSVVSKSEVAKFKVAARATAVRDTRVNIRVEQQGQMPIDFERLTPLKSFSQTTAQAYVREIRGTSRLLKPTGES
jgi:predicted DNA binding CopG/RHH family protein